MRITQQQKQTVRTQLVHEGLRLFREQGFAATTVDQVAAAAGVAKGTFYNYFPAKEDLALAGLVEILTGAEAALDRAGPGGLRHRLLVFYQSLGGWMGAEPELVWLWCIENMRRGHAEPGSATFYRSLGRLFAAGQAAGEIRPDRPPDLLALDLGGVTLAHIAAWYHGGAATDLNAALCQAVDAYLSGAYIRRSDPWG